MRKSLKLFKDVFLTKTPIYVIFFVTSFCNAGCKMCFNWKNIEKADSEQELTLDEIKKIFGSLSSIAQLTISGGEPFLREDLPEILEFISKNNDVLMITVPTNGIQTDRILQQSKKILQKISKDTHLRIELSVEGVGKKHDDIVQVKGAFRNLQNTYHRLHALSGHHKNLNIDISICCSGFNKAEMKDALDYCNLYFKDSSISLCLARGDVRDTFSKKVTSSEYREIVDYYHKMNCTGKDNKPFSKILNTLSKVVMYQVIQVMDSKKMPGRCYAYSKLVVIQSNGDVFPCEPLNRKLGNLRDHDYDLKSILKMKENKKVEKSIREGGCYCTWECALYNNLVCNPRKYPQFLRELLRDSFRSETEEASCRMKS